MSVLNDMLNGIPDSFDKRQSSVIFTTLSTTAIEIENLKINTEIFKDQTYLLTAQGVNLDNRGADFNIQRYQSTPAVRIAEFTNRRGEPYDVSLNSRFSTPNDFEGVIFFVSERLELGKFLLTCEVNGTVGNQYQGAILPLSPQNTLGTAVITGTQIPAQDTETDTVFRLRILDTINHKRYGGNLADYRAFTRDIDGVGDVRVIPVPYGEKTVKLIVVSSDYQPVTQDFMDYLQQIIDPDDRDYQNRTGGLGIAPIWHFVTIETPDRLYVDIAVTVTLSRLTLEQLEATILQTLENMFNSLRQSWANSDTIGVFISHISCALLTISEVINAKDILINGEPSDLYIDNHDIPFLGEVTLSVD